MKVEIKMKSVDAYVCVDQFTLWSQLYKMDIIMGKKCSTPNKVQNVAIEIKHSDDIYTR